MLSQIGIIIKVAIILERFLEAVIMPHLGALQHWNIAIHMSSMDIFLEKYSKALGYSVILWGFQSAWLM